MSVENLTWRRAMVYGLGLSGRAAATWLRRRGIGVVAVDQRPRELLELGELGRDADFRLMTDPEVLAADLDWSGIDALVVSPGIPPERPLLAAAKQAGVPILGEIELAYRFANGDVLAITGSNGKSTTTALTGAMLRAAGRDARVCGNIGAPFSAQIPSGTDSPTTSGAMAPRPIYVVELSSFQLETVDRFHPRAAALINLAPDHLDRHADFAAYQAAKLRLFARQTRQDLAILNADDATVAATAPTLAGHVRFFSRAGQVEDGCHLQGDTVVEVSGAAEPVPLFAATDVPLPGPHNLENAMAAALLARSAGAAPEAIRRGLHGFRGLPHRLQQIHESGGVVWYDDSKGTNPAATVGSLSGFEDGRVLIILGGIFKGGDLGPLARLVARKARLAYLIGEAASHFERALRATHGMTAGIERVGSLENAVRRASEAARPGEVVLLSPACSSFDQFTDYAERGRAFRRLVHELVGVPHGA